MLLVFLISLTLSEDDFEGQEDLGEFSLSSKDAHLEGETRLYVNDTRDVQSHVEQTWVQNGFEEVSDLKVAVLLASGNVVENLDDEVLVIVDFLGQLERHGGIAEGDQHANSKLLSEVLVLLHAHDCQYHKDKHRLL